VNEQRDLEDEDEQTSDSVCSSPTRTAKKRKIRPFNSQHQPSSNNSTQAGRNNPASVLYPYITELGGYIGIWEGKDEDKKFVRHGKAITIEAIYHNIESDEITYKLYFDYQGRIVNIEMPRSDLTKVKILQLADLGADVFDHNAVYVIKWLRNQETILQGQVINVHHEIGWAEIDNQLVYKANKAVGFESAYKGRLAIAPKGSLEGWQAIIETYVLGSIPLESMLIFGLSAIVVGMIAKDTGIDSPIVHIYSESSSGKSTATKLAISAFSYPDLKEDGLYGTWLTTKNASVASLRGNNGMAVAFDELSLTDQKDLSSMVYSLASGKDKVRMQKDDQIRKTGRWNTTILSNGEQSLLVKTNRNTGLKMRKLEFGNVGWTESAEQADAIFAGLLKNYGQAAPTMAQALIDLGKEQVIAQWKAWCEKVLAVMPNKDQFSDRIAAKIAVMMVTADLARMALKLAFNLDGILAFIIQHEQQAVEERDIFANAYKYLLEQVNINNHKFDKYFNKVDPIMSLNETWGKIEYKSKKDKEQVILILPIIFNKLMSEGGFQDPQIILKNWKKQGILDCESDRFTRNRKINGADAVGVYAIRVQKSEDEEEVWIEKARIEKARIKEERIQRKKEKEDLIKKGYIDKSNTESDINIPEIDTPDIYIDSPDI